MKLGRPRIFKNSAARQAAYRLRVAIREYNRARAVLRRAQAA
jgi:hypothetical protein